MKNCPDAEAQRKLIVKRVLGLMVIASTASAAQYVDNQSIGLQERLLMRGSDYVEMCAIAVNVVMAGQSPKIDGCLLYTEGLRTGYGKATTEVVMQASLFHTSPTGDDWNAALKSPFYDKLNGSMRRCDLGESTPVMAQKLYAYVQQKGKGTDVMASVFFHFLKDEYSSCK